MLSLYFVPDFAAAMDTCFALLKFGGAGHTAVIYSRNDARIREYALRMPAMRVLVNTPAPQGSTGITTNVFPSMTLGCGAVAGNITSDNVGPQHLINIKRLAYVVRKPEEAFEMPLDYNAAPGSAGMPVRVGPDRSRRRGGRRGALPGVARHRRGAGAPRPAAARRVCEVATGYRPPACSRWWRTSRPKWWTASWRAAATPAPQGGYS